MLEALFKTQKRSIDSFFSDVNLDEAEKILALLASSRGTLIFTGVGKSGYIAEKLAMTYTSIGVRALFLPPSNALHGDIGLVSPGDLVIFLSKSGESAELLNLIPHLKTRGAELISWVSTPNSRLSGLTDHTITLPVEKELCPFDLAPTTSTAIQLIFGDIIAVALMEKNQISLDDYFTNHPGGAIGKKISLKVSDLMLQGEKLPIARKSDKLIDVLVELTQKKSGCLLIIDERGTLLGIFTDGDLRRALQESREGIFEKTIGELMTTECISVSPKQSAVQAAKQMQEKRYVQAAPVLEDGKLVGLIRMHDIIHEGIT